MKRTGIFWILLLAAFASCETNDTFEKMAFFGKQEWSSKEQPSFDFEVTDTTARYRFYFVIRHTDAYRWNNVWANITVKSPDSSFQLKREFILSDNKKWLGTAIDDIIEQRIPFEKNNDGIPLKKGKYTFTLQQVMREDPLQSVLNAGIRVEKIK